MDPQMGVWIPNTGSLTGVITLLLNTPCCNIIYNKSNQQISEKEVLELCIWRDSKGGWKKEHFAAWYSVNEFSSYFLCSSRVDFIHYLLQTPKESCQFNLCAVCHKNKYTLEGKAAGHRRKEEGKEDREAGIWERCQHSCSLRRDKATPRYDWTYCILSIGLIASLCARIKVLTQLSHWW